MIVINIVYGYKIIFIERIQSYMYFLAKRRWEERFNCKHKYENDGQEEATEWDEDCEQSPGLHSI